MSERFEVGDLVECVSVWVAEGEELQLGIVLGGLYTVTGFGVTCEWRPGPQERTLHLREAPSPDGWRAWRFRKYRSQAITRLIEEHTKSPNPQRERVE